MALDMFLTLDGITTDTKDGLELLSVSWASSNFPSPDSANAAEAGKASFQDMNFTMASSTASPQLLVAMASGQAITTSVLTFRRTAGAQPPVEFLKITLTNCLISSYEIGASSSQDVPTDQISINFEQIESEYTPQNPDGTAGNPVTGGYDIKLNQTA